MCGVLVLALASGLWWWLGERHRHWPAWEAFAEGFIQADGRVVDHTAGGRTVSEGQAYAAFFALVANDRERFDAVVSWTRNNLSDGSFATRLPAWLWGEKDDGSWGVIDANPASDADLWLIFALFEAARLWGAPDYNTMAQQLLIHVKGKVVPELPGVGSMLIPAPEGFLLESGHWRLNPSYLPEFQFRYLQERDPEGPWMAIWRHHLALMQTHLTQGLAPDWYEVDDNGTPSVCSVTGSIGSYDAIRVYLWAAMAPTQSSGQGMMPILAAAAPVLRRAVTGEPIEKVDTLTGEGQGTTPAGFAAALLPYFDALGDDSAVAALRERLKADRHDGHLGQPAHYFEQVLALFGEGFFERRFGFDGLGRLNTRWMH